MARRAASSWPDYLRQLLHLWNAYDLGPDFKVGNLSKSDIEQLLEKIETALKAIEELELSLGIAIVERENIIRDLEKLGVQFRFAIALKFGLQSAEVKTLPKLTAPHKGRKRKKKDEEEEDDSETGDEENV